MSKIIHFCWFGNKPLPRLAVRCIKSWKKYLPDYQIIMWSEANVDLNECPFIREAYQKRKWAFVADYARAKALYEYGGIYFDTDMMITKNIDFLLEHDTFLGIEDSRMVNAAVWGEKNPKSPFAKKVLDFYRKQKHFNDGDIYSISIPRIITKMLNKYGFNRNSTDIQVLNKNIYVYPRDYFYPLSYNYRNNKYSDNTCMIHYFDASWAPIGEKKAVKIYRMFGEKNGQRVIETYSFVKRNAKRALKLVLYPAVLVRRKKLSTTPKIEIDKIISAIESTKSDYIALHNPHWLGVTSATIELFDSRVPCGEIRNKAEIKRIGDTILKSNVKQVIFSAMCIGWKDLAIYLKARSNDLKIKVFWHGSHSQVSEPYGWARNLEIIDLHKKGIIDVFGTCKESILNFYHNQGYKEHFLRNNVKLRDWEQLAIKKDRNSPVGKKIKVGLYAASSNDWRKNMYAQIAAVSLLGNAVIDIVPLNNDAIQFAKKLNVEVTGVEGAVSRDKLLKRMSQNDINLYVTFSECAPMLPLESFEVGVPCIAGDNHHYFKDNELKDYLLVNNEADADAIATKVKMCLDNREKVFKLYDDWKEKNDKLSKKAVKDFLEM